MDALLAKLAAHQASRPMRLLLAALVSVLVAGALASQLSLKTSFGELLPRNKESVKVADQVAARLPAVSTLAIVAEGGDEKALRAWVDALAPKLRKLDPVMVGGVDEGVQDTRKFFEENRFLYAPVDLVEEVTDEIHERYDWEVGKRAGTLLDEDDAPPPLTEESIKKRLEERASKKTKKVTAKFPGGYYLDPKRPAAVVLVRTPIGSGDVAGSARLKAAVQKAVDEVNPKALHPGMRVGFTGNLITSAENYKQISGDLIHVGVMGSALILGVILLFYMRVRTLLAMALTSTIGVVWTFGLAEVLIGYLDTATGFSFTIVLGNGINFGILYMARYVRAREEHDVLESVRLAHQETWRGTAAAAAAACTAYGSLAVTDFRGFKHFGLIGGTGMVLCWIATYTFMPAILVAFEKVSPIKRDDGLLAKLRGAYGRPFAFVATRFPMAVAALGLLLTLGTGVMGYRYLTGDPMEYDMKNIRNESKARPSEARRLMGVVDSIVGRQGQDGIAIATDRVDQVLPLKAELEKRREAAPKDRKPFGSVVTIFSLLPTEQQQKIDMIVEAKDKLRHARRKGFITEKDWKKLDELIPDDKLRVIGIPDLPEQVARSFVEKDGTRGRLVYIVPAPGRSVWDAHYLIDWAASFRTTTLPDGSVVKGSGRSVIFADLIMAVVEDAPKAAMVSLVTTLLIMLFAFRGRRETLWVMFSLLAGLAWMFGALAMWKSNWPWQPGGFRVAPMRINFLNFIAIPITIGVGADFALNVMHRYRLSPTRDIERTIVDTGGAVILCSLTTILGYVALNFSVNQAARSFGLTAALGEICCLISAVLVMPAALAVVRRRRAVT